MLQLGRRRKTFPFKTTPYCKTSPDETYCIHGWLQDYAPSILISVGCWLMARYATIPFCHMSTYLDLVPELLTTDWEAHVVSPRMPFLAGRPAQPSGMPVLA